MSKPIIEPLGSAHDRAAFSCGNENLDRYLKQQARQDARNRVAAPFVAHAPDSARIIGYYTLSTFSVEPIELPADFAKRLPHYPRLPAMLIGRLAIDRDFAHQGWGKLLLVDALRRCREQSRQVAAMAVFVDAKDDGARAFYEHFGFRRLPDREYRLYLAMRDVELLP